MNSLPSRRRNVFEPWPYWRLRKFSGFSKQELRTALDSKGYKVNPRATETELVHHRERLSRGLICYSKFDRTTLMSFINARKLTQPFKESGLTAQKFLIEADKETKFERFTDLPPELRAMVINHYVDSFRASSTLKLPPLALTSKQMRHEVPPIFSDRCVFELRFFDSLHRVVPKDDETAKLLKRLSKKSVSGIRKVRIRVSNTQSGPLGWYMIHRADATIKLGVRGDPRQREAKIKMHLPPLWEDVKPSLEELLANMSDAQIRQGLGETEIRMLASIMALKRHHE